jgi:DltD protein
MKKTFYILLLKLMVLALPIALLLAYFEYNLQSKNFVSTYSAKKYWFYKNGATTKILILGNSQSFYGINPKYLQQPAFNLANVSQTLYYDKKLTEKFINKMPQLSTVVIGISYFSFFYEMQDISENWRCHFYNHYFNIEPNEALPFEASKFFLTSLYKPKQALQLAITNWQNEIALQIEPNGYLAKTNSIVQINDSTGKLRVEVHDNEIFANRKNEIAKKLENFVATLTSKKIKVVFVTTPVFATYSKFCNPNVLLSNDSIIKHLCKKYNAKYYNFFSNNLFAINDFSDNDHLNSNGALKLSNMLNDSLEALK